MPAVVPNALHPLNYRTLAGTRYNTQLEQLCSYSSAISEILEQGALHASDTSDIAALKVRWSAIASPLDSLKEAMKVDRNPETVSRALRAFLAQMAVKDVFQGGDHHTAPFAVTTETRVASRALDPVPENSVEDLPATDSVRLMGPSAELRTIMGLFYNCCWRAVKEAEFVIRRSVVVNDIYAAHDFLQENEDAPLVDLSDTDSYYTSQDCGLYARSFEQ